MIVPVFFLLRACSALSLRCTPHNRSMALPCGPYEGPVSVPKNQLSPIRSKAVVSFYEPEQVFGEVKRHECMHGMNAIHCCVMYSV